MKHLLASLALVCDRQVTGGGREEEEQDGSNTTTRGGANSSRNTATPIGGSETYPRMS